MYEAARDCASPQGDGSDHTLRERVQSVSRFFVDHQLGLPTVLACYRDPTQSDEDERTALSATPISALRCPPSPPPGGDLTVR